MSIHGCQHERRDAELGSSSGVDLRPVGQEQLDDVDVSARGCQAERGVVADVPVLLVGVLLQQNLHHLEPASGAGQRQRGVFGPLRLGLDVGIVIKEDLHHLLVAGRGRQDQGREALLVAMLCNFTKKGGALK